MDRGYYASHTHTLAKEPSETDLRFMLRLVAFVFFADGQLTFAKGLINDEEPDLWQTHMNGTIERWIDLGQPSDKRLRRACGRAKEVVIINYDERSADVWWQAEQGKLSRFNNLKVLQVGPVEAMEPLAALASRNMQITATIQDGELWLSTGDSSVTLRMEQRG